MDQWMVRKNYRKKSYIVRYNLFLSGVDWRRWYEWQNVQKLVALDVTYQTNSNNTSYIYHTDIRVDIDTCIHMWQKTPHILMKRQVEVLILRWILWGPRYQPLQVQIPGNIQLLKRKHLPSKACLSRWCSGLPPLVGYSLVSSGLETTSWEADSFYGRNDHERIRLFPSMTSEKCKDLAMFDTQNPMVLTRFYIFWAGTCLTIHFQTAALGLSHSRGAENQGFSQKFPAILGGNIGIPTKVPSDFSYAPEV